MLVRARARAAASSSSGRRSARRAGTSSRALLVESLLLSLGGSGARRVRRVAGRRSAAVRDPGRRAACRGHRRRPARARGDGRHGDRHGPAVRRRAGPAVLARAGRRGRDAIDARRTRRMPTQRWLRGVLVIVEVALAVVLLVGSGLFLASFARVTGVDLGLDPTQRADGARPAARRAARDRHEHGGGAATQSRPLLQNMLERVRAIPGVDGRGARGRRRAAARRPAAPRRSGFPAACCRGTKISTPIRFRRTTSGRSGCRC